MNVSDMPLARRLTIGVAFLLTSALVLYVMIFKPFASEGMKLVAEFDEAGQSLSRTSPVKIRGVQIGRIESIGLGTNGRATITMRIHDGTKIPDTVKASIEPASVFGPKFVNLIPGAHEGTGPFLTAGSQIKDTAGPKDLNNLLADADQTIGALDPQDIQIITSTLAEGLGGQGDELRELLGHVGGIVDVAHDNRANAKTFLNDLGRLSAIPGAGNSIGTIIADTNAVIDTAAGGEGRLRGFAEGVRDISGQVGDGFGKHGGNLGEGFRSTERAIGVVESVSGIAGPTIRTLIDLIPIYREVGITPAEGNRRLLGVDVLIALNPCQMFLGICTPGATKLPAWTQTGGR